MKKYDFDSCMDAVLNSLDAQFNFVVEAERHDPQRKTFAPLYLDAYFAIIAEGLVLGVTCIAFWALHELIRRTYARITRPKYYPQENAHRRRLAAERRKIRQRRTLNIAPTAEELRVQYAKVRRNPKEMIRFGSMLCDLEAYVDNGLVRDEHGTITGRRPGIKGWLADHCPEMSAHYKTVIRYKALAEKFRQAVGLADPHPAAEALGDEIRPRKENSTENGDAGEEEVETTVRNSDKSRFKAMIDKARAEAETIFSEAGGAEAGLMAALGRRLDPDMILEPGGMWRSREILTA